MSKQSINLRVESGLHETVAELAALSEGDTRPTDLSRTARKLILIGLAFRREGLEPQYEGPLGVLPRPFATPTFGGESVTFGTQLETDAYDDLQGVFEEKPHTAAREALRLGIIAVQLDQLNLTGPLGTARPFAKVSLDDELSDIQALAYLRELRTHIGTNE